MPDAVAYVRDLLLGFGSSWMLSGGWAVDAWLGRPTREHGDVDITVFHHDQRAVFDHFPGWALVGHDPNVADGHLSAAELGTSSGPRPRDEVDFLALRPTLTAAQRSWLRESLAEVQPTHSWLAELAP